MRGLVVVLVEVLPLSGSGGVVGSCLPSSSVIVGISSIANSSSKALYNRKLVPGCQGTVRWVDDMGTIHVSWDCGSSLGLIPGEDEFKKI